MTLFDEAVAVNAERCPFHQDTLPMVVLTPELSHYGKMVCGDCGHFIRWLPKPTKLAGKRREQASLKQLFFDEGVTWCQMCMRDESDLPSGIVLHVHHLTEVQDGGGNARENLLLVCSLCHQMIHLLRSWNHQGEALR